jgi:glutaredoxin
MTTIYVKPDCPYCAAAVRELRSRREPFEIVDVLADPHGREQVARLTDDTMVLPVVVEDNGAVRYTFGGG